MRFKYQRSSLFTVFTFFLLFLILLGATSCSNLQKQVEVDRSNNVKIFQGGILQQEHGIYFLTVSGSHYDAGLQYGVLLQDEIQSLYKTGYSAIADEKIGKFFLKRWIANIKIGREIKKIKKRMPQEYLYELKGIAKGSKLSLRKIEFMTFFPQLFLNLNCTSIIDKDDSTLIHGRNLDWPLDFLNKYGLIVEYNIIGKKKYVNIGWTGYPGCYTGINEDGLSVSDNVMEVSWYDKNLKPGIPIPFKIRQILEQCGNLKDVDNILDGFKAQGEMLIISSKKDHSGMIYEFIGGEVLKTKMHDNFIYATNLPRSEKARKDYTSLLNYTDFNVAREKKIEELDKKLIHYNPFERISEILHTTAYYHYDHNPFYSKSINNEMTIESCIFDNTNSVIYIAFGKHFAAKEKYVKYNLNTHKISVFKERDTFVDDENIQNLIEYRKWLYKIEKKRKNKLKKEDHLETIERLNKTKLNESYKHYQLAYRYFSLEEYEKAHKNVDEVIKVYPDYHIGYILKGVIYYNQKMYQECIEEYKNALNCSTTAPSDCFKLLYWIALNYDKELTDKHNASIYAQKALDMISGYYVTPNSGENDIIKKLKEIRRKNGKTTGIRP